MLLKNTTHSLDYTNLTIQVWALADTPLHSLSPSLVVTFPLLGINFTLHDVALGLDHLDSLTTKRLIRNRRKHFRK